MQKLLNFAETWQILNPRRSLLVPCFKVKFLNLKSTVDHDRWITWSSWWSAVEDGRRIQSTLTSTTMRTLHKLSTVVTGSTQPPLSAACLHTQFTCWSDASCIPLGKHCDGISDCVDQSDEFACTSKYTVMLCRLICQTVSKADLINNV